ncbi:Rrf2 family transcriptional regulator [Halanaeroarchaeum sulfurireducens]|uniref:TrmB family transcriptional regulator n=1 Tax=Halanaeroarchaeum sulfurireducens TaxID=1604004 RepID=A0A0F7PDA4_9EURY|nr:Rrf2 family transcriptional regulator [Halanaeroarchaeum sulfurireducens]AKH97333.1 TrmB family transcriptional regulator [Halanaeroarchaeum sulfurireducens]
MNDFELTDTQREALSILLERYRETEQPVSGSHIAEEIGRSPSTISKYMKELRSLNLVISLRGQKGGYRPTANAFGVLDADSDAESESLYLVRGYDRVDMVVEEIEFPSVRDGESCVADIYFESPVEAYEVGDLILIGPTPGTHLVIGGEILRFDSPTQLRLDVGVLEAPVTED